MPAPDRAIVANRAESSASARSIVDLLGAPQGKQEWIVCVAYWFSLLLIGGLVVILWFNENVGPGHPSYAVLVAGWALALTPAVAIPSVRIVTWLVPHEWLRVPQGERVFHRLLGVGAFAWFLERSGYNRRVVDPLRNFTGTRAGLPALEGAARGGAIAHATAFAIHLGLSVAALIAGYPWGALWILLPGVPLHLYPVLLQRSIMLRLQPLVERARSFEG